MKNCKFTIHCALLSAGTFAARAHEQTRPVLPSPLRDVRVIAATSVRTSAAVAPADACQLTLRLVDEGTRDARAGLVRVMREDGSIVPLAGLVNRGIGLRRDHPARAWHVVTGAVTIPVPRGRLTVEAIGGLETELARQTIDASGATASIDLRLRTFTRPRPAGWIAGNTHLHLDGGGARGVGELSRAQADEYLRTIPRGDGLDVVFVSYLERAIEDLKYVTNGYTLAELQRLGGPDLLFGHGQEHRHNFPQGDGYGHVMFLDLRELIRPVSIGRSIMREGPDWPPLRQGIGRARDQAATVIWCHNGMGLEDVPSWLAGLVDAQNIFDGGTTGSYRDSYYRYLNVGLKVPFSAGTDWFIYDFSRVYVRVTGELTTANWLAGLRAGRTFITNGPLLEFHAGASQAGDTLRLASATDVPITGSARARHDFGALELIQNGRVVQRVPSRAVDRHFEAEMQHMLRVDEPGWVAIRVAGASLDSDGAVALPANIPVRVSGPQNEMGQVQFAHTSPVYLELGGRTIFDAAAAALLMADMETAITRITAEGRFDTDTQRDQVLEIYRRGIGALKHEAAR